MGLPTGTHNPSDNDLDSEWILGVFTCVHVCLHVSTHVFLCVCVIHTRVYCIEDNVVT